MKARLLIEERTAFEDRSFVEMVVWELPEAVPPCKHKFKYRLVYVVDGKRVLGYDNERGKGDHVHTDGQETPYKFTSIDRLVDHFFSNVRQLRSYS